MKDKVLEDIIEKEEKYEHDRHDRIEKEKQLDTLPLMNEEDAEEKLESNISKIVSESITKILIVIIMGMIFIIPLLDWGFWLDEGTQNYYMLANTMDPLLDQYNYTLSAEISETLTSFIKNQYDLPYPIVNVTYFNPNLNLSVPFYINYTINTLVYRLDEIATLISTEEHVSINFVKIEKNNLLSIINLSKTIFICIVLVISSFMFEGDANELVLRPLDVMTNIINQVVNDPIGARNLDAMNIIQEVEKQKQLVESEENLLDLPKEMRDLNKDKIKQEIEKDKKTVEILEEHAEIQVIQKSILKISALLAIGFGEAGSDIIKSNLKSTNDLDPMLPGIKKSAFLGFCDIRGFALVNEALGKDSVIFVNRIAEIVHKSVDKFGGATNKNIGDAFLNVWKFPDLSPHKEKFEIHPTNIYSRIVADKAVLSFLYVVRAIKLNQDILDYSEEPRIKNTFNDIGGYKVNMGFGLHYGWAIEGTVGSKYKIDASYLSPNVNIAARLEAATRQYGVTILISGNVYEFLSTDLKDMCREIDRVTVKGSINAIRLFTIDVNLDLPPKSQIKKRKENVNSTDKIKKYLEKKILYKNYFDKCDKLVSLNFRTSFFLKRLGPIFENTPNDNFKEKFGYGFQKYIDGKWFDAVKYFKKCLSIVPNDEPTKVLLKYMAEFSNIAPSTWRGYRELTSK